MSRLSEVYKNNIVPNLKRIFNYGNLQQIPKIEKIVLSCGVGKISGDSKKIKRVLDDVTNLSGQQAVIAKARVSVAGFKLREGQSVGIFVTLRKEKMYLFLDRLINIALPRVRDFRGIPVSSFDGNGNCSFGVREQLVFPEVLNHDLSDVAGLNVTIVTSAKTNLEAFSLLKGFNLPLVGNTAWLKNKDSYCYQLSDVLI